VVSLVTLAACHREAPLAPAQLPSVKVLAVAPRQLDPRISIAGVLAPLPGRDVKVGSLVVGRVDRVFVAEGDVVRAQQVLAHVEAQPLHDRVAETEAQKEQAKAALENARTRLAAESALKQAQAVAGTANVQLDRATLRAPIAGVVSLGATLAAGAHDFACLSRWPRSSFQESSNALAPSSWSWVASAWTSRAAAANSASTASQSPPSGGISSPTSPCS
jgi:multidrug efflux pump subunit AcrA (membrane-fusion protein)